ncbi:MAG TPA: hypothetical protein VM599_07685 [Thermoanaerobaculia bacterium]|nr:hypothetical protein [Thermoanaerobaculia bacterium]
MTTFPRSPKVLRGAIVAIDVFNPVASVIVFQYNPESMTRSLQARMSGAEEGERAEAFRLEGPPQETIAMKVEIDATDQLERGDGDALAMGIYPQLSALEMILYPKSAYVVASAALALLGTLEIQPPEAPLTLLVWGAKRVLPVRLDGFSIEEEAYDVNLNPIRATVSMSLRVLSYHDLPNTPLPHVGSALFLAHQVVKETMATLGSLANVSAVAGGDVKLN